MSLGFLTSVPTPAVIGMIHVPALPGTPRHDLSLADIVARAVAEAEVYADAGVDAIMLENMHDVPYLRGTVGPEITAAMTAVAIPVAGAVSVPVGVQVLAGANREALAVALAADLQFVRVEGFVFGHVADEGWLDGCAGPLLRYRRQIGAGRIQILADIKKKHSAHAVTADVSLVETAAAAVFAGADGLIVTGSATGQAADPGELDEVCAAVDVPVVVGSGVTAENLDRYLAADALVVGSHFKDNGHWTGSVNPGRITSFLDKLRRLR